MFKVLAAKPDDLNAGCKGRTGFHTSSDCHIHTTEHTCTHLLTQQMRDGETDETKIGDT